MARLDRLPEIESSHLLALPCPTYETTPWVSGPPLAERRLALVSTAGLHRRGDRPFGVNAADYRVIPVDLAAGDLVMSHISTNFDRTGFQMDWNVVFPLDRLRELVDENILGSLADFHYSLMGATHPKDMEGAARHLAAVMKSDRVDAVLLVPV